VTRDGRLKGKSSSVTRWGRPERRDCAQTCLMVPQKRMSNGHCGLVR